MKRFSGVAIFMSGVGIGIFAAAFLLYPPAQSSDWAAWAQAVGSVAAIVGTVMVTRMQMRHASEQAMAALRDDRNERLRGVMTIVRTLHLACGRTQRTVKQRMASNANYRETINGLGALSEGGIKALRDIPLHIPPYSSIAREIIVIRRAVYLYEQRISRLLQATVDPMADVTKAQAIVERMAKESDRLERRINRLAQTDRLAR
jgi:hypothetical protein